MIHGDRTVHGVLATGVGEIVRYDRAGKWYVEWPDSPRRQLTLAEAAKLASLGRAYLGRPGGKRFDAAVRATSPRKDHS